MQDAQDVKIISRNGVDYRVRRNPDGTFTTLGPVSQAQGQADPTFQYQAPQAEADVVRTQTQTAGQGLANQYDAATLPARMRQAEADADAAEAAARDAQLTPGQRKADEQFAERYAAWTADGGLVSYLDKIAGIEQAIEVLDKNDTITGEVIGRLPKFIQQWIDPRGPELRTQVERIVQGSMKQVLDSQFASREADMVLQRLGIDATQDEAFNSARLKRLSRELRQKGEIMDAMAREWEDRGTISEFKAPTAGTPVNEPQRELSDGETRSEINPKLRAMAGQIGVMINQGASYEAIADYARNNGLDPASDPNFRQSIQGAIQHSKTPDYERWQQFNPGAPYPVSPDFYTTQVPMSNFERLNFNAANTGAGAGVISAADALTGYRLDNMGEALGGDAETFRSNMALLRGEHPTSSFLGDMAGEAGFQVITSRVPGLRGLPNSRVGRVGEDAIFGAYGGFGNEDLGVAGGVAANVTGGVAGRGMFGAAGRMARGVTEPNLQYLYKQGVNPTVGQIGKGTGGPVGGFIGRAEEVAAGTPGPSGFIGPAYERSFREFDSAAFRQAGASGDNIGREGLEELGQVRDDAYNFIDPLKLPYDAQFAGRQAAVRADAATMPKFGADVAGDLSMIDRAARPNAELTGRDWQSGLRTARGDRSSLAGQPFSDRPIAALRETEDNLIDLVNRHGPAGTADELASANATHRDYSTLTTAMDNGPVQKRGEIIGPDRLDTAARQSGRNFGGRSGSMQGNRPFYDLTQAGVAVLPNRFPDSGTAGRAALLAGAGVFGGGADAYQSDGDLGETAEGAAKAAAVVGLPMAAMYSKTGQRTIAKSLLSERPQWLIDILEKSPVGRRQLGMFGSTAMRDWAGLPEY